jgi:hypothetical protein
MDLTNTPISSTVPTLLRGNFLDNLSISSTKPLSLSVSIGPGAMLRVVIFLWENSLLKHFNTEINATL